MKRILLISDLFYPNNIIGALRPTKIAKALTARGYTVDVFTRYRVDAAELHNQKICSHLYGFQDIPQPEQPSAPGFLGRCKQNIKQNCPGLFSRLKKLSDFSYYRATVSDARDMEQQMETILSQVPVYDVVFSTFGPLSSVLCGLKYKQLHPEVNWICDFRDPMVSKHVPHVYRHLFRSCQEQACHQADSIVAVSNGYLERICQGRWSEKSHMIPNGYDLQDFTAGDRKTSRKFTVTYVGALYGGDRDLTPLFRAVSELREEGVIDTELFSFDYAGDEPDVFAGQAKKFGVESMVTDHGILRRKDCLDLQFSSQMLVLSTWNDKTDYGVFPGKLLEYMLIGAPIVSLTCGTMAGGEVTRVIREGKLGIAYEQAADALDYPQLKSYLKESYLRWKQTGSLDFHPDQAVLDRYNYETVIDRIEKLL